MNFLFNALAGAASGLVGAMGFGGGGVLVLYLVLIANVEQVRAQGINLLFFIPIAIISLIIHNKNHLIKWKAALPMIVTGFIGVGLGAIFLNKIQPDILRKIFAFLIFVIGISELFRAKKEFSGKSKKKQNSH